MRDSLSANPPRSATDGAVVVCSDFVVGPAVRQRFKELFVKPLDWDPGPCKEIPVQVNAN